MQTRNIKKWKKPIILFRIFLVFIMLLYTQLCYISLFNNVYGIDMQAFAKNRNTYKSTVKALRGNIYSSDENILAQTVTSYTVIAYLSKSRTGNSKTPLHVVDKEATAKALSPLINMSEERIMSLLSQDLYQVELGPGGRGITELKKEAIEALHLPGIDFIQTTKRFYPNGSFASYIVGYAKKYDEEMVGELGIEAQYNSELNGKDGYIEQQQDRYGYKIPDTHEINVAAENGTDIYLTIDSNIQRLTETTVDYVAKKSDPTWFTISVMEAKTGKILASSSLPTYNPNELNITNYENLMTSLPYEPGSVMKIFTYLCAMENNVYDGNKTYKSGSIKIGDIEIHDYNKVGWGIINYDTGFERSSNVAVATMMQTVLNKEQLRTCLKNYGFGSKTGIDLPRELSGSLNFNYDVEVAAASYGQGITTTPVQQLQALSIVANNGTMIKPRIIDKIVDANGKIIYQSKLETIENVAKKENVLKIRELMYNVVNSKSSSATGKRYKIPGFDVCGKTGTAQIFYEGATKYSWGSSHFIYSFSGMYPKDDPDVIIFASMKEPQKSNQNPMADAIAELMQNIATYRNTFNKSKKINESTTYKISDYVGMKTKDVQEILKNTNLETILIGDGEYIINQYPLKETTLLDDDRMFLITNNNNIIMPNMNNWSKKEVNIFAKFANIEVEYDGLGYVIEQSIAANEVIKERDKLKVKLKDKEI